jgi:hypothetical protein
MYAEEFEDTKGVIRIRKSKKDRQQRKKPEQTLNNKNFHKYRSGRDVGWSLLDLYKKRELLIFSDWGPFCSFF